MRTQAPELEQEAWDGEDGEKVEGKGGFLFAGSLLRASAFPQGVSFNPRCTLYGGYSFYPIFPEEETEGQRGAQLNEANRELSQDCSCCLASSLDTPHHSTLPPCAAELWEIRLDKSSSFPQAWRTEAGKAAQSDPG